MTGAAATQKSEACVFLLFWEPELLMVASHWESRVTPSLHGFLFLFSTDPKRMSPPAITNHPPKVWCPSMSDFFPENLASSNMKRFVKRFL